jgi:hypothetical protein
MKKKTLIYENSPWKLAVQNSVRPVNPENRLTGSFSENSQKQGSS